MNTIGFFGDSFCAEQSNEHSLENNYDTYITLLAKHYNANIVNLGCMGSSIYDTILIQLQPLIDKNEVPDICVFCWTSNGRLFHPTIRNINFSSAQRYRISMDNFSENKTWHAAKLFYEYLYNDEQSSLEYKAILKYIDDCILTRLPSSTKIVNLWSFGPGIGSLHSNPHVWKNGSEVATPLASISICDYPADKLSTDPRPNHLDGQFKNNLVFEWVKTAIDNPNSFWDYPDVIKTL